MAFDVLYVQTPIVADERCDIDLVLARGAGASRDLAVTGTRIAAMKEWSDRLTVNVELEGG
jgi:hypothetical protein